jgi:hypothetical protein
MALDDLNLPADARLAGKMLDGHVKIEQTKIERGKVGEWLGSTQNVPSDIAGVIALVASIVLIGAVSLWAGTSDFTHKEAIAALSSLVTLALGYLFGRASK